MPMSPTELAKHDKRMAAIHEAGHATVGVALGCFGEAWLRRNESGGLEEKCWVGSYMWPTGQLKRAKKAVVGVAGMVAEALAEEPECSEENILDWWESEVYCPSPTDLASIPRGTVARFRAVRQAVHILREKQSLFELIVSHIIEHEFISEIDLLSMAGLIPLVNP